jgi:predicted metal-dependent phosphoesterase TrpH
MGFCDLHIHSHYSDGTLSPIEIVDRAKEKDLTAISITDHDEIKAIPPARTYGKERDIMVLSGVELSAIFKEVEIHVLGYLFDIHNGALNEMLRKMKEYREKRAKEILRKLEDFGFNIEFQAVKMLSGNGTIGRPHIAQAMLETKNIRKYKEAFEKYIGNGKPCNVPKFRFDPQEAIDLLRKAGGVSVLAHPGNINEREIFDELINIGFDGIEVWHPDHSTSQISEFLTTALEKNLLTTGGSDNHGDRPTKAPIGGIEVDDSVVASLIEYNKTQLR